MAGFEVRIRIEALAAGRRLVRRGKDEHLPPETELEPDADWRESLESFCVQTIGEIPTHLELVDAASGRDGLFPVLVLKVRCYLPKAKPPLSDKYAWVKASAGKAEEKPATGGTLDPEEAVVLYTDGGSRCNPGPAGVGELLIQEKSGWSEEACRFIGEATNNVAEYTALLDGLCLALQLGIKRIEHRADSQLMVRQLEGAYKVKSAELKVLFDQARALISSLEYFRTVHVPREQNKRADELANRAMDEAGAGE